MSKREVCQKADATGTYCVVQCPLVKRCATQKALYFGCAYYAQVLYQLDFHRLEGIRMGVSAMCLHYPLFRLQTVFLED